MATLTYIRETKQSVSAMKGVIDYCCQQKKVYDSVNNRRLVGGINCDGENAFTEFMTTKNVYKKTDGINFYQYVQSFSPEENITHEQAHQIALEFAEKAWPEHEILVTTHCDAGHIHSHFVINSVSFVDGHKLRQNPNTLKSLRKLNDEICQAHGLNVLFPYEEDGIKISTREYRAAVKGQSWKFALMNVIDSVMNTSGSKAAFIVQVNTMGYKVAWTDERKYITFTTPSGMKCRDIKLHDEKYRKENLENEFKIRRQIYHRKSQEEQFESDFPQAERGNVQSACGADRTAGGRTGYAPAVDDNAVGYLQPNARDSYGELFANDAQFYAQTEQADCGEYGETSDADAELIRTGWEESRTNYQRFLEQSADIRKIYGGFSEKGSFKNSYRQDDNCSYFGGNFIGNIDSFVYSLSGVIDDSSKDEEERKKRIEAQQNGSNIGTAVGITIGLLTEALDDSEEHESEDYDSTLTM